MTPSGIQAGMSCTVGWFSSGGMMGVRRDFLAAGKIVFRRGGAIKFQWESGDTMDADFPGWPSYSCEYFRVNILDIKSLNGIPIAQCANLTAAQVKARLALRHPERT